MKLYIDETDFGECIAYKQVRGIPSAGWLFIMDHSAPVFVSFPAIHRFTSCGELRIITESRPV